ncbi:MAG: hypothetical protein ACYC21_10830 [Eubacteriales bacterium]
MFKNLKIFIAGALTCMLLTGAAIGVIAATGDIQIKALLAGSIKMKLNGKDFNPRDIDGTYIEVIKSMILKPGETTTVDINLEGIKKFCIISDIKIGHDKVNKLVIGEPSFSNS